MNVYIVQAHGVFEGVIMNVYAKEEDAIAACAKENRKCEDEGEEYRYLKFEVEG